MCCRIRSPQLLVQGDELLLDHGPTRADRDLAVADSGESSGSFLNQHRG
jgi:hypothetical protein